MTTDSDRLDLNLYERLAKKTYSGVEGKVLEHGRLFSDELRLLGGLGACGLLEVLVVDVVVQLGVEVACVARQQFADRLEPVL